MGDPWIRMRVSLAQDPTVLSLGLSLGTSAGIPPEVPRRVRRRVAVGMLLETWGIFHLEADGAGLLAGYTLADLDEHVGVSGWGQSLVDVGWIVVSAAGVTACGFEMYIGSKKANQERERSRKRAQRAGSGVSHPLSRGTTRGTSRGTSAGPSSSSSSSSESGSGGEPERGAAPGGTSLTEAIRATLPEPTPDVVAAAREWDEHAREMGTSLTRRSWMSQLVAAQRDPAAWVAKVRENLAKNTRRLQDAPQRKPGASGEVRLTAHEQANQRKHAAIGEITDFLLAQFPDSATPAPIEGAKR